MEKAYPQHAQKPIWIEVHCLQAPTDEIAKFLSEINTRLLRYSIKMRVVVVTTRERADPVRLQPCPVEPFNICSVGSLNRIEPGYAMPEITVDKIIEDKGTGVVILWLRQPEPWDTPNLMSKLQDKINGYIAVIREGPLLKKFPQYAGRNCRITLVCHELPPQDVKIKLDRVNHNLLQLGIEFRIMLIKVETPGQNSKDLKEVFAGLWRRVHGEKTPRAETFKHTDGRDVRY